MISDETFLNGTMQVQHYNLFQQKHPWIGTVKAQTTALVSFTVFWA